MHTSCTAHPRFPSLETAPILGHVTVMVMHQRIYASQVTSLHYQTEEDHQDTASFLLTRDSKIAMSDLAIYALLAQVLELGTKTICVEW